MASKAFQCLLDCIKKEEDKCFFFIILLLFRKDRLQVELEQAKSPVHHENIDEKNYGSLSSNTNFYIMYLYKNLNTFLIYWH